MSKSRRKDKLLKRDFDAIKFNSTITDRQKREERRIMKRQMSKVRRKRAKVTVRDYDTIPENEELE